VARCVVAVSQVAREIGFADAEANKIATAASELARNILKYAGKGELLVEQLHQKRRVGVAVIASDRGPGITNIDEALTDHFSSGGTLGLGLPGVKRMMDEIEIESKPGQGTRVCVRKWLGIKPVKRSSVTAALQNGAKPRAQPESPDLISTNVRRAESTAGAAKFDCAFFIRPCRGERVSGDIAVIAEAEKSVLVAMVDALGHGREASVVAKQAASFLRQAPHTDVVKLMSGLHETLQGTVGAAAGIGVLNRADGLMKYVGVGNTVARSLGQRSLRLSSTAGTLGTRIRSLKEQRLQLNESDVIVFYTDGVSDRFETEQYPQLRYESAATIARAIVDRFGKDHDDAGCVVVRSAR
jgi:anti-sigma regulatory factor (Ser/Thr protein kinase)